jgi:hypothetical protein
MHILSTVDKRKKENERSLVLLFYNFHEVSEPSFIRSVYLCLLSMVEINNSESELDLHAH